MNQDEQHVRLQMSGTRISFLPSHLCRSMSLSWCKSKAESPSVAEIFIELSPINKQVSSAAG